MSSSRVAEIERELNDERRTTVRISPGLQTLPPSLMSSTTFAHIVSLDLSRNRLSILPKSLGLCCPNLTELMVYRNNISVVEFGAFSAMPKLCVLYLSDNNLSSLPCDLRELQRLRFLDISSNKFMEIPCEVALLPELFQFEAGNNPLLGPYAEAAREGVLALQSFLLQFVSALSYDATQWLFSDQTTLTDATLLFQHDQSTRSVHSIILSREPLFAELKSGAQMSLEGSPMLWEIFLCYIYTGLCSVDSENLAAFSSFADLNHLSIADTVRQMDKSQASAEEASVKLPSARLGEKISMLGSTLLLPLPVPVAPPKAALNIFNDTGFSLYLKQLHCDHSRSDIAIISSDNVKYPVHRTIVGARVPLFRRMLSEGWKECATGEIKIPCSSSVAQLLVEWLYLGNLSKDFSIEDTMSLLELGKMYDIEDLVIYTQIALCKELAQVDYTIEGLSEWSKFHHFSLIESQIQGQQLQCSY